MSASDVLLKRDRAEAQVFRDGEWQTVEDVLTITVDSVVNHDPRLLVKTTENLDVEILPPWRVVVNGTVAVENLPHWAKLSFTKTVRTAPEPKA